eukprot:6730979-Prymnesium_polylepis.1
MPCIYVRVRFWGVVVRARGATSLMPTTFHGHHQGWRQPVCQRVARGTYRPGWPRGRRLG